MLSTLLPGLRQLRTPLAAGFILIVAAVATIGPEHLRTGAPTGVLHDAGQVLAVLGKAAGITVLTFAAYVLGVVWQATWQAVLRMIARAFGSQATKAIHSGTPNAVYAGMSRTTLERLREVVAVRLREEARSLDSPTSVEYRNALGRATDLGHAGKTPDVPGLLVRAGSDALIPAAARELLELIPSRLMAQERDLWSSWDQARAEAEFRSTIALPLAAVFAALAVVYHPGWWAGVLITPSLLRIAARHGERATAVLLEAVRIRKATLFVDGADMPVVQWSVSAGATPTDPVFVSAGLVEESPPEPEVVAPLAAVPTSM